MDRKRKLCKNFLFDRMLEHSVEGFSTIKKLKIMKKYEREEEEILKRETLKFFGETHLTHVSM